MPSTTTVERAAQTIAPFGLSESFPLSEIRPPHAWTVGTEGEAQCGVVAPTGHRTPLTPKVDQTHATLTWRIPHEGMVEYWEFAHVERPRVSGVVTVIGEMVMPVAPWDERCQDNAHLRGMVQHYRLHRLVTGCGLGLPGNGSDFYKWAMAQPGYRKAGGPSYEAETVELIRTVLQKVDQPDTEEVTRAIRYEWASQFGEVPKGVEVGLQEATQLPLRIDGPTRKNGRTQITRRNRPGMEFGR